MPTQSYRFYDVDPAYQATLQSSIHNFRLTHQTNPTRHPHERSDHYEQTNADAKAHNQEHGHAPWSQSAERTDFENAARTGCDMSHVISHRSWVQCDWSNRTPICPSKFVSPLSASPPSNPSHLIEASSRFSNFPFPAFRSPLLCASRPGLSIFLTC
jgi:hypothetical protein